MSIHIAIGGRPYIPHWGWTFRVRTRHGGIGFTTPRCFFSLMWGPI